MAVVEPSVPILRVQPVEVPLALPVYSQNLTKKVQGALQAAQNLRDERFAEDEVIRRLAVDALHKYGPDLAAPHAEALAEALATDTDAGVRYWCVVTLVELRERAAPHALAMANGLTDRDPGVRYYCALGLSTIGAVAAAPHVAALLEAVKDTDPDVCVAAAKTLVATEPAMADHSPPCTPLASTKPAPEAVEQVVEESADPGGAPDAVARSLTKRPTLLAGAATDWVAAAAELLAAKLVHGDPTIRASAADALCALGPQRSEPYTDALVVVLKDRHVAVRLAGLRALAVIGKPAAIRAGDEIERTVKEDPDAEVRVAAWHTQQAIGLGDVEEAPPPPVEPWTLASLLADQAAADERAQAQATEMDAQQADRATDPSSAEAAAGEREAQAEAQAAEADAQAEPAQT